MVWLIGNYVLFIEEQMILKDRRVTGDQLVGWLRAKLLECKNRAMPDLGYIPGVHPTGIG